MKDNIAEYTLNIAGKLLSLREPLVMGILNCTPDSFYEGSRKQTEMEIAARANEIIEDGGRIIDVGAFSTRPGADQVSEEEEMERMRFALHVVRGQQPDAVLSVDTFRRSANDIDSDETADCAPVLEESWRGGVPYVLMSSQGSLEDTMKFFALRIRQLRSRGQRDIILDPGFGFGKTMEHNCELMRRLGDLRVLGLPLMVGVSRKSMIYRLLGTQPDEALNGTTVLNTMALMKGASILRVHDVRAAAEAVRIVGAVNMQTK